MTPSINHSYIHLFFSVAKLLHFYMIYMKHITKDNNKRTLICEMSISSVIRKSAAPKYDCVFDFCLIMPCTRSEDSKKFSRIERGKSSSACGAAGTCLRWQNILCKPRWIYKLLREGVQEKGKHGLVVYRDGCNKWQSEWGGGKFLIKTSREVILRTRGRTATSMWKIRSRINSSRDETGGAK